MKKLGLGHSSNSDMNSSECGFPSMFQLWSYHGLSTEYGQFIQHHFGMVQDTDFYKKMMTTTDNINNNNVWINDWLVILSDSYQQPMTRDHQRAAAASALQSLRKPLKTSHARRSFRFTTQQCSPSWFMV